MAESAKKKIIRVGGQLRAYRKAQGLCTQCGKRPPVKKKNGRMGKSCADCREAWKIRHRRMQENQGKRVKERRFTEQITDEVCHAITLTGQAYRVKRTGKVGVIMPCPGDDPIVLQFPNGKRKVYHRKEVVLDN